MFVTFRLFRPTFYSVLIIFLTNLQGVYSGGAAPTIPICAHWIVATSEAALNGSKGGWTADAQVQTTWDVRYSIKVEAKGLKSYTKYYYKFQHCDSADLGQSIIGQFKTLPGENESVDQLRLAVFSCSNLPFGFFNAVRSSG